MKRRGFILLPVLFVASCQEHGSTPGQKLDSLIQKVDTTANQFVDSSKSKLEKLKNKVNDIHIHIGKDSTTKDTSKR